MKNKEPNYGEDYNSFVYEWSDRSTGMKYVGSHLGSVNDGYTGSGKRFRRTFKKRPEDFIRTILEYCWVENVNELQTLYEQQHLDNIKDFSLYYNLSYNAVCPAGWNKGLTKLTNPKFSNSGVPKGSIPWNVGACYHQKKIRDNTNIAESNRLKAKNEEWLNRNKQAHNRPDVKAKKIIASAKSKKNKGKVWITNDIINKMIEKNDEVPKGYRYGKLQRKKIS